jgi:phage host-nuclease inhibitor protein Gam
MSKKNAANNGVIIASIDNVDQALKEIYQQKQKIEAIHTEADNKINAIKDTAAQESLALAERIQKLENGIITFVEKNRNFLLPLNKRSLRLTFGVIGYRLSNKIVIKDMKATLEKIKMLFKSRAKEVIIKKESPDKNALDKWADADLKRIGVKRESDDVFYYELNEAGIKANLS